MQTGDKVEAMVMAHQAIDMANQEDAITTDLLTRAAMLAQHCNLAADAWRWLRQALKAEPANAALQRLMARTLIGMGDASGAVDLLTELLDQYPGYHGLRLERLRANIAAEQFEQAALDGEELTAAEPDNQTFAFFLELARRIPPQTQPASLVSKVYDDAAASFDHLMVQSLNYRLPEAVAAQTAEWFPARNADILDLGCGTGLYGRALQPWQGVLVGVDVSKNMIVQAGLHNAYASFHRVNLLDALQATPADHYDVISALDVFGCVGDLTTVMPGAFRVLNRGGRFVFSFEELNDSEADFALDDDLVYHYRSGYVLDLLSQAGFVDIQVKPFKLRVERSATLIGQLILATKPT
ncbi:MAG: methyltransferase [Comamonadaceae bacterium]|nr:methyltransferase [Comamonadaceae bacterium]